MNGSEYIALIIKKLQQADPEKIILFGSHAHGKPGKDSDIDIMVVTSDNFIPETYSEKMNLDLKISELISDIKSKYPVDLIVHTKPMHKKFLELGSMFSKEITKRGKVLYERNIG